MRERGILFTPDNIRAILREENPKTQTRRVVKEMPEMPIPDCHPKHMAKRSEPYFDAYCGATQTASNPRGMDGFWNWWQVDDRACLPQIRCPYGVPGDRLWVRETFLHTKAEYEYSVSTSVPYLKADTVYAADYEGGVKYCGFTPSIFMPRQLSRITLEITDVKMQRLDEITEEDARAEGFGPRSGRALFKGYWDVLNGKKHPWDSNPFVWAISFQRV